MKAERLLQHYEQIADAPDAIARLRRFILDLAVRGKLVPQAPADEPALELLKRIEKDKNARAVSARDRRAEKIVPLSSEREQFPIAGNWIWARFGDVTISRDGERIPVSRGEREQREKKYDYYGASGVIDKIDGYLFDKPLLLIGEDGANLINRSTPIAFIARGRYWVNNHAHVLDGLSEQLLRYLELFVNAIDLKPYVTGTAQPKMNQAKMNGIPVALPPLAEQHRIVAKVDELMALCDELEGARTERETKRDRLAASSLARLNTPDPETFRDDARFTLDSLAALTARPDQIKQLRQTILNLAVRGKLVPQDPADEPAEVLDTALPRALPRPFELPASWKWSRLRFVGKLKGGGTPSKSNSEFWGGNIPWVSPKDMKVDYLFDAQMTITETAIQNSSVNLIDEGSLLFVVRGMILAHSFPVAINQSAVTINQDMKALTPKNSNMAEYLLRALKGLKPQMLANVQRSSHGTCRLEGSNYSDFLIPIPPLAEQHRIVAKVDELMVLCDQMEASLTTADDTRRKLLDALLAEALAPVSAEDLQEAAE